MEVLEKQADAQNTKSKDGKQAEKQNTKGKDGKLTTSADTQNTKPRNDGKLTTLDLTTNVCNTMLDTLTRQNNVIAELFSIKAQDKVQDFMMLQS